MIPAASKVMPGRSPRRAASVSPTSEASVRRFQSSIEPETSSMAPFRSARKSSLGTPRKVTTSRLVRQLDTTTLMGTADATPSTRWMRA